MSTDTTADTQPAGQPKQRGERTDSSIKHCPAARGGAPGPRSGPTR